MVMFEHNKWDDWDLRELAFVFAFALMGVVDGYV